ncbi:CLAVATA3/ESR (CLE)-related protein 45 [Raphanus sativus]|uniref:CLAVATA3/ESR (CLE)-related protein 45-like n=1 Tax=Raphanus sativus TaxID=3726 RepID=A0A6J0L6Z7_RAPSA|nr:CLAVATA3/ESR (CLE)-related protein 45-like [Raphanus sativus]KAJ4874668.1 CLAVATA3/ESR (CLE)-related protein 45 [Raphanus sativus]
MLATRMMLLLLVCIGLLSDNISKVSALRNKEFFLRQTQGDGAGVHPGEIAKLRSLHRHNREDQVMLSGNWRILEEANKNKVKPGKTQQQTNMTKKSFQSSKRRVRRGSDPIHNKSEPFS